MQETSQGMKTLLRCSSEPTTAGRRLRTPPRPCSWSWTAAAGAPSRWPAAAGSPGRACPPTAIPGSPRSCRAGWASTGSTGQAQGLRGSRVAGCALPRVGIWVGELESAFSCCRPEGRGGNHVAFCPVPFPTLFCPAFPNSPWFSRSIWGGEGPCAANGPEASKPQTAS